MRKRMTSLLLTLVMLLSLVPAMGVTASAAEWTTVNTYEELQTAVKAKKEYIKLGRDIDTTNFHYSGSGITIDEWLTFEGQTCTLDLNGKTLTLITKMRNMGTFMRVYSGSNLTIKDSSSTQTGEITCDFDANFSGDNSAYMIHVSKSSLTLEGGTFRATSHPYATSCNAIQSIDSNLTIKDGVKLIQPDYFDGGGDSVETGSGYALRAELNKGSTGKIIINGGEFDGCVKLTGSQAENGSVQINKGTFKKIVQVLYAAEENNSNPAVTVNGGTFEDNVYLQGWPWKKSLYMPYRLNGGTFYGSLNLCQDSNMYASDKPKESLNIALGLNECFGYSAIAKHDGVFTAGNIHNAIDWETQSLQYWVRYKMLLKGSNTDPVRIIPNAWGIIDVTLDGDPIDYFKNWNGAAVEITNDTAHTLKFEWNPLAQELKDAKYSYDAKCEHYVSGSTAVQETENIAAGKTSHTITIKKGAEPKVYSFDLKLNLEKNGNLVGIVHNQHIVKLVVKPAEVPTPDPTIDGTVYYTSGIVFGSPISISASVTPAEATKSYQWQRSTDGGSTWTNIEDATSGKYTPVAADMGKNIRIRVVVTAEGYLGEIVGAPLTVSKAANNEYPDVVRLEAVQNEEGAYIGFKITNFDSDCEYVYTTSAPTSGNEWPTGGTEIDSNTVTSLTGDKTYYVFARFEETNTHTAGSIVSRNSIGLFDKVPLQYVLLEGYDGPGTSTIYIKEGESVELKVSADPSNANSWKEITFKERSSTETGCITVTDDKIDESGENAVAFPKHSITINGVSKGSATLDASYSGSGDSKYGRWYVVVYDDSTVDKALRLENVYTYADITLSVNDEAKLPTDLPKLLPEGSGYHLEWRILKGGTTGGYTHVTENDNIELDGSTIKPKAAHDASGKTQLELVAVKDDDNTTIKLLPKTSLFYVTVTEAPTIELTGVTVAPKQVNLELNKTFQLSAVKQPANAPGDPSWESDNTGVATVDSTGMVTAKGQGTAKITVTCGKKTATCTVLVDHKHSYEDQPYLYLDPGNHYQECVANDGSYNIEAHDFGTWTKVDADNHSRTCSKCMKSGETANYTETAEHTWVWVVDHEAALNQPGLQHEECTGCHATRSENTVIPALQDYAVTVTGGTAAAAAGTPITRAMEGVEVTVTAQAPAGKHFVKWVVKEGGVTLANETSATTTFIMPANDVTIEANFEKNASTGTGAGATTYPITVKSAKNGDVTASHKTASKGTTVILTVDPDKGYVLDTLTVLDGKDKERKLTDKGDGKYSFIMPADKVTVEASFKEAFPDLPNPFSDLAPSDFCYDAVMWAVGRDITGGIGNYTFGPNLPCTRAQAVTFLWRAAGSPEPETRAMPFTDVPVGSYYYNAVLWTVENGITEGTSDTMFSPDDTCSRAQIVTFLWRAGGSPAASGNSAFTDVASDAYYAAAVIWAEKNDITGGIGGGLFGSNNNCTRGQIATFIYRSVK